MNREGVRKPTWFAYKYLNQLTGREIPTNDELAWASVDERKITILAWDWQQPVQDVSNRPFYTRKLVARPAVPLSIQLKSIQPGSYRLKVHRTGYLKNDPLSAYIDMGLPSDVSAVQLNALKSATSDQAEQDRMLRVGSDGLLDLDLAMRSNDVVLVTLEPQER